MSVEKIRRQRRMAGKGRATALEGNHVSLVLALIRLNLWSKELRFLHKLEASPSAKKTIARKSRGPKPPALQKETLNSDPVSASIHDRASLHLQILETLSGLFLDTQLSHFLDTQPNHTLCLALMQGPMSQTGHHFMGTRSDCHGPYFSGQLQS